MIKDVIVNLGLGERSPAGDFAVSLAAAFDAYLLGIGFAYEPVIPGALVGGIPPEFIQSQQEESDARARAAVAHFEKAAKREGLSFGSRMMSASVSGAADIFTSMARRFDLAVVDQAERDQDAAEEIIGETVMFGSGRPVIFVPFIQKGGLKLDRVTIAWDGSRAGARAVADSLPLLARAKDVEVVIVASDRPKSNEVPGADLGEHLARHGLKVEVMRITVPDIDVASALLSHAADSSTDFLVMGGYGHSRLREFILGGVTRDILASMTVPVLMSH